MKRLLHLIIWTMVLGICLYFKVYHPIKTKLVAFLLSLLLIFSASRIILNIIVIWYKIDLRNEPGKLRNNLIVGLTNLFNIFYVIAVILGVLSLFGFNAKEVFTSLSIIAAALAVISKDFISEMVIGLYNGFSTKIELDDYIKVGVHKGKIIDIGLQKVTLLTDDDDIIYIPNLKFYNEEIINYTKKDIRTMSVEFGVDPKHFSNIPDIESALDEVMSNYSELIEPKSNKLSVVSVEKDNTHMKYQYTLKSLSRDIQRDIRKNLMRKVLEIIKRG